MGQVREHFDHRVERGFYDEVDEADLTLGNVGCLSVVELTHWEVVHFLEVTLGEELNEQEVAPVAAQAPSLGWVRNVRQVEHELNEDLFVLRLRRVEVFVGDARADLSLLDEVLRHVGRHHCLDDHLTHSLEVLPTHLRGPVVRRVLRHQLERGSNVMVLKHTYVIVTDCDRVIHTDEEDIVDAWVFKVVKGSRD